MTVAWIGSRESLVDQAVKRAAELLAASRCPVFSVDSDVNGTRAAVALAERAGAAYGFADGELLARETALFSGKGAMVVAPGEVRRRADVVVIVGALPLAYHEWIADLAATSPDLGSHTACRTFFHISGGGRRTDPLKDKVESTRLSCGDAHLNGVLAAVRAQYLGRQVSTPVRNFERFASALENARFTVFLFSGHGCDALGLEMLQGLIADINRKQRASGLHLPATESGWGAALASTWMTGFPQRVSFARGFTEFDPWRFDPARTIAAGEADLHFWVSSGRRPHPPAGNLPLVALTKSDRPVRGAAVSFAIGEPGVDHDRVTYSARTGSLAAAYASSPSRLPSAASVLLSIAEHLTETPC
jgi:formylmethanofuran dehydrogenase subunit B